MTTPQPVSSAPAVLGIVPLLSGVLAGLIGCVVPLAAGVLAGWSAARTGVYLLVALAYLMLISIPGVPLRSVQAFCNQRWPFIVIGGSLCLALQSLSGDAFIVQGLISHEL